MVTSGVQNLGYIGHQVQDYWIPDIPGAEVLLTVRGGDGGDAVFGQNNTQGGEGATVTLKVTIGQGTNEIRPGGRLRFVVGEHGGLKPGNADGGGGGGGGGTGVIYEVDGVGDDWVVLAVAGGGGGGFRGSGVSRVGKDAPLGFNGDAGDNGGGNNGNGGQNGLGGEGGTNTQDTAISGGGGGILGDGVARGDSVFNNSDNFPGKKGLPTGGAGGEDPGAPAGGWGMGGGGSGEGAGAFRSGGGGGGGYSGGGGGAQGRPGGGGGSYGNPAYGPVGASSGNSGIHGSAAYAVTGQSHDERENALPIDASHSSILGSTVAATSTALDGCFPLVGVPDVWYTYTNDTTEPQVLQVSAVSGVSALALVDFFGNCLPSDALGIYQPLLPNGTVFVGVSSLTDSFELAVSIEADSDGDGIPNSIDSCSGSADTIDTDGDGVPDGCDICPGFDDASDLNGNGIPDGCEDCDEDGIANPNEIPVDLQNATDLGVLGAAGETLTFTTCDPATNFDTGLFLWDAAGDVVATGGNDLSCGPNILLSTINVSLPAGDYILGVSGNNTAANVFEPFGVTFPFGCPSSGSFALKAGAAGPSSPVVAIGQIPSRELGVFRFTVAQPCSIADVAVPYGLIDSADVVSFLLDIDPALAAPVDVADFFDVLDFLQAVDSGCP